MTSQVVVSLGPHAHQDYKPNRFAPANEQSISTCHRCPFRARLCTVIGIVLHQSRTSGSDDGICSFVGGMYSEETVSRLDRKISILLFSSVGRYSDSTVLKFRNCCSNCFFPSTSSTLHPNQSNACHSTIICASEIHLSTVFLQPIEATPSSALSSVDFFNVQLNAVPSLTITLPISRRMVLSTSLWIQSETGAISHATPGTTSSKLRMRAPWRWLGGSR
jgi:hypothetical protein